MTFSFLSLPGEIRNRIYSYYFQDVVLELRLYTYLDIDGWNIHKAFPLRPSPKFNKLHALAIRYACRQIYTETNLLAITHGTVAFRSYLTMEMAIKAWPRQYINAIRCIRFLGYREVIVTHEPKIFMKMLGVIGTLPRLQSFHVGMSSAPNVYREWHWEWHFVDMFNKAVGDNKVNIIFGEHIKMLDSFFNGEDFEERQLTGVQGLLGIFSNGGPLQHALAM